MARLKFIIAVTLLVLLLSLLALADSRPWDDHILCPKCESERVVYILYGEPKMGEDLKRALDSHKVELAGCMVTADSHRWECRKCGHKWEQVQPQIQPRR
jgi:hypothetical protein